MSDGIARRELIAPALEEAAQRIIREDVPLSAVPELLAALQGSAMRAVLDARITLFLQGHTPENDEMLPIGWLPMEARTSFEAARELLNADEHRGLDAVRAMLAKATAFGLAAIERLDRAMKRGES